MSVLPVNAELFGLFKLISYSGALSFVPCVTDTSLIDKRMTVCIQQVISAAVFLLLLFMSTFEVVEFVVAMWNMNGVGELMPSIIWASSFPLGLTSQIFYTIKRPTLFNLLRRWEQVHFRFEPKRSATAAANCFHGSRMYIIYFLTVCISVVMVMIVIVDFPVFPHLPAAYGTIGDVANLPVTCVVFATALFYAWSLSAVSDLVPSIIYHHLALAIESVARLLNEQPPDSSDASPPLKTVHVHVDGNMETEKHISVEDEEDFSDHVGLDLDQRRKNWQQAWLYYEAVRDLVDEVNVQFGLLLLLNHGALFFVASSMIFAFLRWFRGISWILLLIYGLNIAGTLIRLSSTILLCSRLATAGQQLRSRISKLASSSWFAVLTPSERQFFTMFLLRVQDGGTVAAPLGLYHITPAMLLTMGSLLVTYLVVLLQSSEKSHFENFANITGLITGSHFFKID